MSNIFIANDQGHDHGSAEVFLSGGGKFIPVTQGREDIFDTQALTEKLKRGLEDATPHDYLLLSGNQIIAVLATCIMLEQHGEVTVLMWGAKMKEYVARTITREALLRKPVTEED